MGGLEAKRWKQYVRQLSVIPELKEAVFLASEHLQEKQLTEEETIRDITHAVLAPALNAFVLWVLEEALRNRRQRLYFLARDGYFMYQSARNFVEYFQLPIECRYFYCSRYSLRVPMYHLDMEEALSYITLGGLDVTMERILERAAVTEEQKKEICQNLDISYELDEQIPRRKLENVKDALRSCETFMQAVQHNSIEALPVFEQYIRQEGMLDEIPMAIVDSGWVGSMQKQLNRLIARMKGRDKSSDELEGYYWGLYELPGQVRRASYHSWYFSPEGEIRRKVHFSNCLFEGIFSAPHGMTMGYELVQGKVRPQLASISTERKEFLECTGQCLKEYQESLIEVSGTHRFEELLCKIDTGRTLQVINGLLKRFMGMPTRQEALAYGRLEFSDDVLEYSGSYMAASMNERELRRNHLITRVLHQCVADDGPIRQSAWYEGSAAIYSRYPGYHRVSYAAYKYFLYFRQRKQWRQRNECKE